MSTRRGSDDDNYLAAGGAERQTVDATAVPVVKYYRRTREEAVASKKIPLYEMYDMDTGFIKDTYRDARSPSPPMGTRVYEVGTGRPYEYVPGSTMNRIMPDSVLMKKARQAAVDAGVWQPSATDLPNSGSRVPDQNEAGYSGLSSHGLHRVIPLARMDRTSPLRVPSPSYACEEIRPFSPKTAEQIMISTDKVLRWHTETPEPLEDLAEDTDHEVCNCISLVTSGQVCVDMTAPDLADTETDTCGDVKNKLLANSPTMRYLQIGYHNYIQNGSPKDTHRLSAYACHSAITKVYSTYKAITCRPKTRRTPASCSHQSRSREVEERDHQTEPKEDHRLQSDSPQYTTLAIINQYFNVFSTLADFNYKWVMPGSSDGICNILVVDKLYTYNESRRVYQPYYRLLSGDSYTDLFVNEILKMDNNGVPIKRVRFLSTPNTLLYTNILALSRRGVKRTQTALKTQDIKIQQTNDSISTSPKTTSTVLPLKKRHVPGGQGTMATTSKQQECYSHSPASISAQPPTSATSHKTEYVLRSSNWPKKEHQASCSPYSPHINVLCEDNTTSSSLDADVPIRPRDVGSGTSYYNERTEAKNPTLIVFKHNTNLPEPNTLICNIIVELHLGKEILY